MESAQLVRWLLLIYSSQAALAGLTTPVSVCDIASQQNTASAKDFSHAIAVVATSCPQLFAGGSPLCRQEFQPKCNVLLLTANIPIIHYSLSMVRGHGLMSLISVGFYGFSSGLGHGFDARWSCC